jgi:Protein of unknown function (DUF3987)
MTMVTWPTIGAERVTVFEPVAPARLPLFPEMPPAEPYPMNALGPVLGPAAAAISNKVQAPEAIAAQSVLAAASLVAQAHADVMLPYGQTRPLSLYLATVAGSGDRKSSADNEAIWPIRKYERTMKEAYERDIQVWLIEVCAWKAEKKKIESNRQFGFEERRDELKALGPEPRPPLHPFLTVPDPTVEGLTKAWVSAPASLGVFTAEGGQFVGGHGMSVDQRLKTAATYSQIWDGQPVKRVRAGDGVTILSGRRLSMHIMIQPEAATTFLGDSLLRDQGLLSRVLVAAPASIAGGRLFREPAADDDATIQRYGARLLSILERSWPLAPGKDNELEPRVLSIDPEATAIWRAFYDHVERQSGPTGDLAPVRDFASKAAEHAARIAGVLTVIGDDAASTIQTGEMRSAVALMDWYVNEVLRMHSCRVDPHLLRAHQLLEWLTAQTADRNSDTIPFRDILRFGPNAVRVKQRAEEAILVLVEHEWIEDRRDRPRMIRIPRS